MGAADAATARATIVTAKRMMNDLCLSGLKRTVWTVEVVIDTDMKLFNLVE
jgi:hypothetical protein